MAAALNDVEVKLTNQAITASFGQIFAYFSSQSPLAVISKNIKEGTVSMSNSAWL